MNYLTALITTGNEPIEYIEENRNHHLSIGVEKIYWLSHRDIDNFNFWGEPVFVGRRSKNKTHQEEIQLLNAWWRVIKSVPPTRWLALIDNDELIITDNLPELLHDYEYADALGINWRCFGSSGHLTKVFPQLTNYTARLSNEHPKNRHIKSIIDPAKVIQRPKDPHYLGIHTVNEKHEPITGPFSPFTCEKIVMNHYWTRSWEDWLEKAAYGSVNYTKQMFDDFQKECSAN